jgi:hypothetical protein
MFGKQNVRNKNVLNRYISPKLVLDILAFWTSWRFGHFGVLDIGVSDILV